jgi:hypothetical protein
MRAPQGGTRMRPVRRPGTSSSVGCAWCCFSCDVRVHDEDHSAFFYPQSRYRPVLHRLRSRQPSRTVPWCAADVGKGPSNLARKMGVAPTRSIRPSTTLRARSLIPKDQALETPKRKTGLDPAMVKTSLVTQTGTKPK